MFDFSLSSEAGNASMVRNIDSYDSASDRPNAFFVFGRLDKVARVWVVASTDVPGLNIEADSYLEFVKEVNVWAKELLVENGAIDRADKFSLMVAQVDKSYSLK